MAENAYPSCCGYWTNLNGSEAPFFVWLNKPEDPIDPQGPAGIILDRFGVAALFDLQRSSERVVFDKKYIPSISLSDAFPDVIRTELDTRTEGVWSGRYSLQDTARENFIPSGQVYMQRYTRDSFVDCVVREACRTATINFGQHLGRNKMLQEEAKKVSALRFINILASK